VCAGGAAVGVAGDGVRAHAWVAGAEAVVSLGWPAAGAAGMVTAAVEVDKAAVVAGAAGVPAAGVAMASGEAGEGGAGAGDRVEADGAAEEEEVLGGGTPMVALERVRMARPSGSPSK